MMVLGCVVGGPGVDGESEVVGGGGEGAGGILAGEASGDGSGGFVALDRASMRSRCRGMRGFWCCEAQRLSGLAWELGRVLGGRGDVMGEEVGRGYNVGQSGSMRVCRCCQLSLLCCGVF